MYQVWDIIVKAVQRVLIYGDGMKTECFYCGGLISDVPDYVVYDHTDYGKRYEFCCLKCFRSWVLRK
jgi:hypothetical protein